MHHHLFLYRVGIIILVRLDWNLLSQATTDAGRRLTYASKVVCLSLLTFMSSAVYLT